MQLNGAVAVVTGASAGIGEATALALADHGAKVVLAARRLERLEALAATIEGRGGTAVAVRCDVADADQVASLPRVVKEAFGRTDILVNNAGVPGGGDFTELGFEEIRKVVEINLLGVMYGTRAFLPGMIKRHRGHIVNVASLAGRYAAPGAAVYTATKHAVVAFSESLHVSTRNQGVLVTSVNPAFVPTEGFTATGRPALLTITPERVADTIVKVVREGIAPEYSVPRWAASLQAFRVLTPPLYRMGMGWIGDRYEASRIRTTPRSED